MSIGIPIKLLHEAEGHVVTLETVTGEVYRGKLLEAEDNMNCQMQNITVTARDGKVSQVEQVFIRGSMIRFLILPDMLKNAPMFKPKPMGSRGMSAGGGKSAMIRAQGGRDGEEGYCCKGRCVLVLLFIGPLAGANTVFYSCLSYIGCLSLALSSLCPTFHSPLLLLPPLSLSPSFPQTHLPSPPSLLLPA